MAANAGAGGPAREGRRARHRRRPRASRASGRRRERQRSFWRDRYAEDPEFFGATESDFARWCREILVAERSVREIVELGSGYGRDTRFWAAGGWHVRGVDLAPGTGRGGPAPPVPPELAEGDALEFLEQCEPESVDAVYSHLFFSMDFSARECRTLVEAIHRVLRPGGLHLYSVRARSDPWYGRGRPVRPGVFRPGRGHVPVRFFTSGECDRLAAGLFEPVRREERPEGEGEFPIRVWYVVDRRRASENPPAKGVRRGPHRKSRA